MFGFEISSVNAAPACNVRYYQLHAADTFSKPKYFKGKNM